MNMTKESSSWEPVSDWYNKVVGSKGHYYHENVILPKLKEIFKEEKSPAFSLLDLACGQGILSRHIPKEASYSGIDASKSLITAAKKMCKNKNHTFHVFDLTKPVKLEQGPFDIGSIILALQNIPDALQVMKTANAYLKTGARFLIVLNHPCFRIPRQTSWQVDETKKIQYRRVDRYMSPLTIPIQAHPSQGSSSEKTFSYHRSLTDYSAMLKQAGFVIESLEELCSDKTSTGSKARMENRCREEIPMFLLIVAKKV